MAKFTPSTVTSGYYSTTKLNANWTALATLMELVVFRDGTSPNSMLADFDMNSNHILNLPAPATASEPVRLTDLTGLLAGTPTADTVTFTPTGSISSSTVQTAIVEAMTDSEAYTDASVSALSSVYQPLDATLTSISSLGTAADKIAYTTAVDTWAEAAISAFGRTLINLADAATTRSTIGVETSATGSTILASGTTAQRDVAPAAGYIRYNSDIVGPEYYNGSTWNSMDAAATTTQAGIVELATDAEVQTGTDTTRTPSVASMRNGLLVLDTAVTAASQTSIDFTIPTWAKKITVLYKSLSASGTSNWIVQVGTSGGIVATGYSSAVAGGATTISSSAETTGFIVNRSPNAASVYEGQCVILLDGTDVSQSANVSEPAGPRVYMSAGSLAAGATVTTVRITTVGGTDTFDAGAVNCMYE